MAVAPGARFGPYEVLAPIGSGGMGEVYRARDTRLGRDVAIKVLHVSDDRDLASRLEREARLIAAINHPHICALYDIGEQDRVPFLVMELLEGGTLAERLKRGRLPIEQATRYAVEIASAMDAAHRRGVVHRDLKPGNIMLTRTGAKLLDFGIASPGRQHAGAPAESTGSMMPLGTVVPTAAAGTLPYMAPEQVEGKQADPRSDIFSFGAVFYEMLTGHRAFPGDTAGTIISGVLWDAPVPMSHHEPSVPPPLEQLVSTCLAKDREERWQSARDLARTLQWVAEGSDRMPRADAPALLRLAGPTARRQRWLTLGTALAILLVAGAASWRVSPAGSTPRHVAVLPCRALEEGSDRAFCDGIAETLTARLAQIAANYNVQVAPASMVRDERVTTADQARASLGATLAIEGSLLRAGETLRLNYALVDAVTHQQVDAVSLTASAADPFALQDQVVDWARRALQLQLDESPQQTIRARGTQTGEAFTLYQQGRGRLVAFQTTQDIDAAIELFNRAVALDSQYALAYAGLGQAYWRRYQASPEAQWMARARDACARASTLDAQLGLASLCVGQIALGTGRYEDAVAAFRRAIERDPTHDDAYLGLSRAHERLNDGPAAERVLRSAIERRPRYWAAHAALGAFFLRRANYQEAVAAYERAAQLNPGHAAVHALLGGAHIYLGQYAAALEAFRMSTAIIPTYAAYANWGMTLFRMRDYTGAVRQLTRACELRPAYQCLGNLSRGYHWAGRKTEAAALAERAIQLALEELKVNASDLDARLSMADYYARLRRRSQAEEQIALASGAANWHQRFFIALAHAQLGNRPQAFDALQRSAEAGLPAAELRAWPELDALRKDPRFAALPVAKR